MNSHLAFRISAALGLVGVALGAFGAHALNETLVRNGRLEVWHTAVLYQFVHVLVMCLLASRENFFRYAWIAFLIGIIVFSGSLYVLALTNIGILGAITPIGGVAFLFGWGCLAVKGLKR